MKHNTEINILEIVCLKRIHELNTHQRRIWEIIDWI